MPHVALSRRWTAVLVALSVVGLAACESSDGGLARLEAVAITTTALPDGRVAEPYTAEIVTDGPDDLVYDWRVDGALPDGLTLMSAGTSSAAIAGTPTLAGEFPVTVRVQPAGRAVTEKTFILNILPEDRTLRIEAGPAPDARFGVAYARDLTAVGGVGAVEWSLVERPIPGLELIPQGDRRARLEGTPQRAGEFSTLVRIVDDIGDSAELRLDVEVSSSGEALVIEEAVLPAATTGIGYEATIRAQGGAGGYEWTVLDTVPDGLTLDPTGTPSTVLRGIPIRNAFYRFRVEVRDVSGEVATRELLLRVDARPLTVVTEALPSGVETASYRAPIAGGGGTGAYAWRALDPLPPGLTLSPVGTPRTELSGVAEQAGAYTFTLEVEDLEGATAQQTFEVVIEPPPPTLTILTSSVPDGIACLGYDAPLEAVSGVGAYRWSVTSGALPTGVELRPQAGQRVELSGAPTQPGEYSFTVTVEDDRAESSSFMATIGIADEPSVARNIAFSGQVVSREAAYYAADICGATPAPPVEITPADDRTEFLSSVRPLVAPDGSKLAFVGPVTPGGLNVREQASLYVVDLTGPTPGSATSVVPVGTFRPSVTGFRWSPDSEKLAFRARLSTSQSNELYVVDVSNPSTPGTPERVSGDMVTGGEVAIAAYVWSPDSTTVAYAANQRRIDTTEVFFGRPTGAIPAHPLPASGQEADPRIVWRADSGGIFFRGDLTADDDFALYHAALSNGQAGPLTRVSGIPVPGGDVARDRFWLSPNGQWLAFVGDLDRDASENVYAARVTGGAQGVATPTVVNAPFARDREIRQVRWSPTSDALAVLGDLFAREVFELFYVSFVGGQAGGPIRLSPSLVADGDVFANAQTEFWSADGNWIGFLADANIDEKLELYVVDLRIPPPWRATRVSPVTSDDELDAFRFEFAPDGSRIALLGDYQTRDLFELYAIDLRGPGPSPAFRVHGALPLDASVKNSATDTAWKRDGSALFFRADLNVVGQNELWMVDLTADGRAPPTRVNPTPSPPIGDVNRFGFTP